MLQKRTNHVFLTGITKPDSQVARPCSKISAIHKSPLLMITSFNPSSLPSWRFSLARQVLGAGGVVAYPTEGVWGLGCDPDNAEAVARILEMKQRSWTQGLILIADSICRFAPWLAGLTDEQRQKLDNWPVGVTCLIPHNGRASALVAGQHSRLAIRVTDHPIAAGLARGAGRPDCFNLGESARPAGGQECHPGARLFRERRRGSH